MTTEAEVKHDEGMRAFMETVECKNYKRSPTLGKLAAALCKAQLEYTPVRKESENPAFKRGDRVSKYADLFNLVSATRPALNKYGITLLQFPNVIMGSKVLVVESLLLHESDEWVSCEIHLPAADERGYTAHSIGKAITYARRFSWGPLTAAVAEDDDDGNDASGQGSRQEAQDVAKRKIAELEAKKAEKASGNGSNAQQAYIPSLFYQQQPSGLYAITGDKELLNSLYKQKALKPKWFQQDHCFMVDTELLEQVKFQCESATPVIPISLLKEFNANGG